MALSEIKFAPGIDKQNTAVGAFGRWIDSDNVRFRYGLPEKVGGWASLLYETIVGVCRKMLDFVDRSGNRYVSLGTDKFLLIYFEGQLFDAHVFASDLIKKANKSLVVIDNYVDETTLMLLSKHKKQISCTVHTRINQALKKDLGKHNQQYPEITLVENRSSHDRFIILDNIQLYHIGASLKDLGSKCFAFSRMDDVLPEITTKLLKR